MKVNNINPATQHALELKRIEQQELAKKRHLEIIEEQKRHLEKIRSVDPNKGNHIDKMV